MARSPPRKPAKPVRKAAPKAAARPAPTARPAPKKAAKRPNTNAPSRIAMRSVTGQLVVSPAAEAIAWYGRVFGAKELTRQNDPSGKVLHSMLTIGDTNLMVSDAYSHAGIPSQLNGAYLHVHHKDAGKMWKAALAEGAKPVLPFATQFWGDDYGQFRDPYGQLWSLGWPSGKSPAELQRIRDEAMKAMDAGGKPS